MATKKYDYIIVGAGAAGCVLANRLSADHTVLLLEAGGEDGDPRIRELGGFTQLWGSDLDWQMETTPQPDLADRPIVINQGRVVGGSSSINAMMHVRGNRRNYDYWNYLGNDGWSYEDVLPYFRRTESYEGGGSHYRGSDGPLSVRVCPDKDAWSGHFINAATEAGYQAAEWGDFWDYNGAQQENGAAPLQFNVTADGQRHSAAAAYLTPVLERENLTVETGALVKRVVVTKGRAVGVEYMLGKRKRKANCNNEVIVSAGALHSPQLLMVSGIGSAEHLTAHKIKVAADLPGVGQNLQDHVQLPVVYMSNVEMPTPTLLTGNVLFTTTRSGAGAAAPDLQLNFVPAAPAPLLPVLPDFGGPVCIFLPILIQPQSRGEVCLQSADMKDAPHVNPRYLSCEADMNVMRRAIEQIDAIANTDAFVDLNAARLLPPDIDDYIRTSASTIWHPAGTCRMGQDAEAVVDPQLRVHGVEQLRVVDASVMPAVTSGNTHAPVLMIAEKAADMILQGAA